MFNLWEWMTRQGYHACSGKTHAEMATWMAWYTGYVKSFHDYSVYNGTELVPQRRKALAMAKLVCEDWANLLLNERVQIHVDEAFQPRLDEILMDQHWYLNANRLIELSFALGTGAFVEYLGADQKPVIDYYRADMIVPISWDNKSIKECAFASVCTMNKKRAVYVMLHRMDGGQYTIENRWFEYESGAELPPPEGCLPEVRTGSRVPLFQIVTPNIVNSADLDSPMGMSVFANAIDVLKNIDDVYDSLDNEFRLGRKRVLLPMSMAKIQMMGQTDKDGKPIMRPVFDAHDTVFYAYETGADQKNTPIELDMTLRVEEHKAALMVGLALLGKKVGTGCDRYTWDKSSGLKTATEVVSDKSDLYQNLRKHELRLEDALVGMAKALAYLDGYGALEDVKINFDDSIIQDSQAELDNAIAKKTNGLISAQTIMTDVFDMTEEDAEAELARIRGESRVDVPAVDFLHAGREGYQDRTEGDAT